jgi:hypothetical protein
MVPLTLPEVRRLFYYLIEVPPFSSLPPCLVMLATYASGYRTA